MNQISSKVQYVFPELAAEESQTSEVLDSDQRLRLVSNFKELADIKEENSISIKLSATEAKEYIEQLKQRT